VFDDDDAEDDAGRPAHSPDITDRPSDSLSPEPPPPPRPVLADLLCGWCLGMPSHFELTLGTDAGIFVVDTPARPAVRGRRDDAAEPAFRFCSCSYFSRACSDGSLSVRKLRSDLLFGLEATFAGSWVDGGGGGRGDACAS
jgi:hypothetical protein